MGHKNHHSSVRMMVFARAPGHAKQSLRQSGVRFDPGPFGACARALHQSRSPHPVYLHQPSARELCLPANQDFALPIWHKTLMSEVTITRKR
jgi:hypothetical protein